jgi:hypothetical protein
MFTADKHELKTPGFGVERLPPEQRECFGGTFREGLGFLIPFNERHLKFVLKARLAHSSHIRPHQA